MEEAGVCVSLRGKGRDRAILRPVLARRPVRVSRERSFADRRVGRKTQFERESAGRGLLHHMVAISPAQSQATWANATTVMWEMSGCRPTIPDVATRAGRGAHSREMLSRAVMARMSARLAERYRIGAQRANAVDPGQHPAGSLRSHALEPGGLGALGCDFGGHWPQWEPGRLAPAWLEQITVTHVTELSRGARDRSPDNSSSTSRPVWRRFRPFWAKICHERYGSYEWSATARTEGRWGGAGRGSRSIVQSAKTPSTTAKTACSRPACGAGDSGFGPERARAPRLVRFYRAGCARSAQ